MFLREHLLQELEVTLLRLSMPSKIVGVKGSVVFLVARIIPSGTCQKCEETRCRQSVIMESEKPSFYLSFPLACKRTDRSMTAAKSNVVLPQGSYFNNTTSHIICLSSFSEK